MLDFGWQELFIIGILAIIVIGPKDLPRVLKTVMQWVRKVRRMAREFQSGVDEMVREAELDDIRQDLKKISSTGDLKKTISDTIDPTGELDSIRKDMDRTAKDATRDDGKDAEEEESPFKNKSGDELRALIEKEKQKKAMLEAEEERTRVEAEAAQKKEQAEALKTEDAPDASQPAEKATAKDETPEATKEKQPS